ncbi:MAG TPA: stage III sporulation protein SpoIIIAB [Clostridia bacterium]|nr:stage III sporulation protein SpoIIIAB [Clostridia bacterium]
MLKIIGSVVVILAGGLIGATVARSYESRPRELRELRSGLQLLETEIIYGATPLPDALERVAQSCRGSIGGLFGYASGKLYSREGYTAAEAWESALDRLSQITSLNSDDVAVLRKLGSFLGVSDQDDQEKHMRLLAEQMTHQIEKAENDARVNVRLWRYLGISSAVVVVMILV